MAMTSLTPHPDRAGSIARVIIVHQTSETATVAEIDALYKDRVRLRQFAPRFARAVEIIDWLGGAIFWGTVLASFLWRWWVFMPGFIIAWVTWRQNRNYVAAFIRTKAIADPSFLARLRNLGLAWDVDAGKIMPDNT